MRILIVEDDHKLGALLEQGLQEDGFEVARASDGEEAITKAVAADYDLILLGYMLPQEERLRGDDRAAPRRTAHADPHADRPRCARGLKEALRAGVNDLMGKPFRFGELVDRIRSLTSGSPDRRVARAWRRPASCLSVKPHRVLLMHTGTRCVVARPRPTVAGPT